MEITLNNNNQIDFNDSSLKKINLVFNEDVLKEQIKEYQLRYPQESGNVRPITALACLKQQIKLNLGNDSDVAKELNSFKLRIRLI